jgi:excisionase family DNA binding protein
MIENDPDFITVPDISKYLRTTGTTVIAMINNGKIPAIRFGSGKYCYYRVKRSDFEKFLAEAKIVPSEKERPSKRGTKRKSPK